MIVILSHWNKKTRKFIIFFNFFVTSFWGGGYISEHQSNTRCRKFLHNFFCYNNQKSVRWKLQQDLLQLMIMMICLYCGTVEQSKRALNPVDDSREGIERYLRRNHATCFEAFDGEKLVGIILTGHDGRRGMIHHMCMHTDFRRHGIVEIRSGLSCNCW